MKKDYNLFLYNYLSKLGLFKTFASKVIFITLLCFLVALIPIVIILIQYNFYFQQILLICYMFFISVTIGLVLLSFLINSLLIPVKLVCNSLAEYKDNKVVPNLPSIYSDELGVLMKDVQEFVEETNKKMSLLTKNLMIDHLTGVYNRLSSEKRISEDIARVKRNNEILTIAMFDIDDFKLYNDYYGHSVGDECLIEVANTVKNNLRENDWIARWGGDEFLVVFSNVDSETSSKVLLRIMEILKNTKIITDHKTINMSVSIGITELVNDDDYISILKRVDMALLDAKNKGKSKIVIDNVKPN